MLSFQVSLLLPLLVVIFIQRHGREAYPTVIAARQMFATATFTAKGIAYADPTFCNDMFRPAVGPNPGTAYHAAYHCAWLLGAGGLNLSTIPTYPPSNHLLSQILEMAMPDKQRCTCDLMQWREYSICRSSLDLASSAMSFGIKGDDPWGKRIYGESTMTPKTFDCYDFEKPVDFDNEFSPVCVGKEALVDPEGRRFETLSRLLNDFSNGSVLFKFDIEGFETDVFETLVESDFRKVRSLSIEFHLWGPSKLGPLHPWAWNIEGIARTMKILHEHFVVVSSSYEMFFDRAMLDRAGMYGSQEHPEQLWLPWHLAPWRLPWAKPYDGPYDGFYPPDTLFVNYMAATASECRPEP